MRERVPDALGRAVDVQGVLDDLNAPELPKSCPRCFQNFAWSDGLAEPTTILRIRKSCPGLFDASVRLIVSLATDDLGPLKTRLQNNYDTCKSGAHTGSRFGGNTHDKLKLVQYFISSLFRLLKITITGGPNSVLMRAITGKSFTTSKGLEHGAWPTTTAQLLGNDPTATMKAIVFWISLSESPSEDLGMLSAMLSICRKEIFPILNTPAVKTRLLWTVIELLKTLLDVDYTEPPSMPFELPQGWHFRPVLPGEGNATARNAINFLDTVMRGPGASPFFSESNEFLEGHESAMFAVVHQCIPALRDSRGTFRIKTIEDPQSLYDVLCGLAMTLSFTLRIPQSQLDHRVLLFMRKVDPRTSGIAQILQFFLLQRVSDTRHCSSCTKSAKETGSRLQTCAQCKIPRYCSRECQRSDWKAHKPRCLVLCKAPEVFVQSAIVENTMAEYGIAFEKVLKEGRFTHDDLKVLSQWALEMNALPRPYEVRVRSLVTMCTGDAPMSRWLA